MANHKSALKRIKQDKIRTIRNVDKKSRMKTMVKKFFESVSSGEKTAIASSFRVAQSEISKGVSSGVLHKNTASRKISRLSSVFKANV